MIPSIYFITDSDAADFSYLTIFAFLSFPHCTGITQMLLSCNCLVSGEISKYDAVRLITRVEKYKVN